MPILFAGTSSSKIGLSEIPFEVTQARVIITFLPTGGLSLQEHGIDPEQAASLRAKLKSFEEG
jgi:hypothetical protein